jgi:predicted amidohydrolase YtcJ
MHRDTILSSGKIATNRVPSFVEAVAIKDGKITAIGSNDDILPSRDEATWVIDCGGRTVIPGLNDSHMHPIRGGLNYNMELRWDGVPSLADALRMLKEQAERTPAAQWVRVVGGWTEFQFAERRMPTLDEINAAAPDTPVFVLHLYDRALLNGAALRAVKPFAKLAPPALSVSPDWSPVKQYGGYCRSELTPGALKSSRIETSSRQQHLIHRHHWRGFGCDCFAF